MRLARYLLAEFDTDYAEPRSKQITLEEAAEYVVKKCGHSLKGTMIRRTTDSAYRDPARFTDPTKGKPRISRNTSNYYTLIIDSSPKWKRFPKRSKSIIATTGSAAYYVFAENKSKYGVCYEHDFWNSFRQSGIYSMDDFNDSVEDMARGVGAIMGPFDNDIGLIKSTFGVVDKLKTEDHTLFIEKAVKALRGSGFDFSFLKTYINDSTLKLYPYCDDLLDPNKNGFRIKFAGSRIGGNLEVWTDGKAVLINHRSMEDFMARVHNMRVAKRK